MEKRLLGAIVLAVVVSIATAASALAIPVSWTQQFGENGIGPFNQIAMFMRGDDVSFLDNSDYRSSNLPTNWMDNESAKYVIASGDVVNYLTWRTTFSDRETPFHFMYYALNDGVIQRAAEVQWLISKWNVVPVDNTVALPIFNNDMASLVNIDDPDDPVIANPVPEAKASLYVAMGVAGLAFVGRRRKIT